jgi:hypothetical protein
MRNAGGQAARGIFLRINPDDFRHALFTAECAEATENLLLSSPQICVLCVLCGE